MLSVTVFFVVMAAIATVYSAVTGKCPLWVPVLLLCVVLMLMVLPK